MRARSVVGSVATALLSIPLVQCSSSGNSGTVPCSTLGDAVPTKSEQACYTDNDGITNQPYTIAIAVTDTGFTATGGDRGDDGGNDPGDAGPAKNIINTQNLSPVTLTLTNEGTRPHGFAVGCTSVCSGYPTLPAGCSGTACFPAAATIAPIPPGTNKTVTFDTPRPDNVIYPFSSGAPGDESVPGLNEGQWSLI